MTELLLNTSCNGCHLAAVMPMHSRENAKLMDTDMHILAIVVGVIAAAGAWYWRFRATKEVVDDVGKIVGRMQGRIRMSRFKKRAEGSVLASVEDPALAAAIFLYVLSNEKPDARHLSEPAIKLQVARIVPAADLDEVLAYAQWAGRDIVDARDVVRRFKSLWREKLTREEQADLVAMAETIAGLGDANDHNQKLSNVTLRTSLAPEQNR